MSILTAKGMKEYPIHVEYNLLERAPELLIKQFGHVRFALISDDIVALLHALTFQKKLHSAGLHCSLFTFPHGEEHKTPETWLNMLHFLADEQIDRGDCVLALGGGVCGDLAGFAAACRYRGVKLVQIPSSLIAMSDSSIGGKTGFDDWGEKNSVGAFYAPDLVLCDPKLLETLPEEEWRNGSAELIKYGMIQDAYLLDELSKPDWRMHTQSILERCIAIKIHLVERDERDNGERRLLNFGHSFGHAMEAVSDFRMPHGKAVACGMMCAARISAHLGFCSKELPPYLAEVLLKNGLPLLPEKRPDVSFLWADKKRQGNSLSLVLPHQKGCCEIHTADRETLRQWYAHAYEEESV